MDSYWINHTTFLYHKTAKNSHGANMWIICCSYEKQMEVGMKGPVNVLQMMYVMWRSDDPVWDLAESDLITMD